MLWGWYCKEGRLKISKKCLPTIHLSKSEKSSSKSKLSSKPRKIKTSWLWRKPWISLQKASFTSKVWKFHQQENSGSITYKKWKIRWKICVRKKSHKRQSKTYSHFETMKSIWNPTIKWRMSLLSFSTYKPTCLETITSLMRHSTYNNNWLKFKALIHNSKRGYKRWEKESKKRLHLMKFSIQTQWKKSNCKLKRDYMILLKRSKQSVTRTSRK